VATAKVDLTASEFASASAMVTMRALRWVIAIWLGVGLLNLVSSLIAKPGTPRSVVGFVLVGIAVGLFLLVWASALLQYRRLTPDRKHYTWRFFDDHIETESALGSATFQWRVFVRVSETRSLFLFFPQRNICHLVPKRAFPNDSQIGEVRRLAKATLGKIAKVRKSHGSA
jgi:hypothetical protein